MTTLAMAQGAAPGTAPTTATAETTATLRPGAADEPLLFETRRLRCRRWVTADLEPLLAVYGDADGMRFVGNGRPITRVEGERWLAVTAANYAARGYGMFALEAQPAWAATAPGARPVAASVAQAALGQAPVVGFCGLVHPGGQPEPEVKYAFLRTHWGLGLASEAVPALLQHAATAHGLARIIATVAPGNGPSQRVLKKAGMRMDHERSNDDGSTTLVFVWNTPAVSRPATTMTSGR